MLILTFEEFNNEYSFQYKAVSNIKIEDIIRDTCLVPIEIVMRDQTQVTIRETNFNIIVNLHPTDGTHWVLVIRREGVETYFFDSFWC